MNICSRLLRVLCTLACLHSLVARAATVTTDLEDYAPFSFVQITGAGYVGEQTGSGYNTGALHALAGVTAAWGTGGTPMLVASNPALIGVDASASLVLNAQIGQNSTGANNNALTKVGAGTLEFQGALPNTYFGVTTINEGTLRLNKRAGATSGLNYVVGDNVGGSGADILEIANAEQIFDNQQHSVQSSGLLRTVAFPAASTQNEVQQLNVYGGNAGDTFTVTVFGSTTPALPFNIAPSGGVHPLSSLENALSALAGKPSNITFSVSGSASTGLGVASSYTITFKDSNAAKTDQPALVAAGSAGATATVATLNQGGTNVANEEQYLNTGTAAWQLNFGGQVTVLQTFAVAGTPTAGTFQLTGGPLTGVSAAIGLNFTAAQVTAALAGVLPAGVQVVVTQAGTAPNLTYTFVFVGLASAVTALSVTNNTMAPGTVTASALTGIGQNSPLLAQQALEELPTIGPGGVVVTGFPGQQQMLVTFTEGRSQNLRAVNAPDLVFVGTITGQSEVAGTQGSYTNLETLGVGATSPVVTAFEGTSSSAALSIAAGTTLVLANDLAVSARPGLPSSAPGVTIGGSGNLALQPAFATAAATRTFTIVDGPASADCGTRLGVAQGADRPGRPGSPVGSTPLAREGQGACDDPPASPRGTGS